MKTTTAPFAHLWRERRLPHRLKHHLGFLGTLPDFIIAGAQKAGTTTLYLSLRDLPFVIKSDRRELHFFNNNYERGLNWYRARFPTHILRLYDTYVRNVPFLTGESSPNYLIDPRVPARIQTHLPNVKIVILLRNPVDRAYSHYCMNVRHGTESLSFADAIAAEEARIGKVRDRWFADPDAYASIPPQLSMYSYLHRGLYAERLQSWLQTFPSDRLLILKSEDLWSDISAYQSVLSYLGLPVSGEESYENRYYGKGKKAPSRTELDPGLRTRLTEYFAQANQKLVELLGSEFQWLE